MTNRHNLGARHTYAGTSGHRLHGEGDRRNTSTGDATTKLYFVIIREKVLQVEVNIAIDEGLWYLFNRDPIGGQVHW